MGLNAGFPLSYWNKSTCFPGTKVQILTREKLQAALQPTVVPSIENAAQNPQKITTWMQNMAQLHRGNPAPKVRERARERARERERDREREKYA